MTERNAKVAVKDIIQSWNVHLPVDKELRLLNQRFSNSWNKIAEDDQMDVQDAVAFMRDLMTTPLITIHLSKSSRPALLQQQV